MISTVQRRFAPMVIGIDWNPDRHQIGISDRHRWNTHRGLGSSGSRLYRYIRLSQKDHLRKAVELLPLLVSGGLTSLTGPRWIGFQAQGPSAKLLRVSSDITKSSRNGSLRAFTALRSYTLSDLCTSVCRKVPLFLTVSRTIVCLIAMPRDRGILFRGSRSDLPPGIDAAP